MEAIAKAISHYSIDTSENIQRTLNTPKVQEKIYRSKKRFGVLNNIQNHACFATIERLYRNIPVECRYLVKENIFKYNHVLNYAIIQCNQLMPIIICSLQNQKEAFNDIAEQKNESAEQLMLQAKTLTNIIGEKFTDIGELFRLLSVSTNMTLIQLFFDYNQLRIDLRTCDKKMKPEKIRQIISILDTMKCLNKTQTALLRVWSCWVTGKQYCNYINNTFSSPNKLKTFFVNSLTLAKINLFMLKIMNLANKRIASFVNEISEPKINY